MAISCGIEQEGLEQLLIGLKQPFCSGSRLLLVLRVALELELTARQEAAPEDRDLALPYLDGLTMHELALAAAFLDGFNDAAGERWPCTRGFCASLLVPVLEELQRRAPAEPVTVH